MALTTQSIVLVYKTRSILTTRPATFAEAIDKAVSLFNLDKDTVYLTAKIGTAGVEIAEDAWTSSMLAADGQQFNVEVRRPEVATTVEGQAGIKHTGQQLDALSSSQARDNNAEVVAVAAAPPESCNILIRTCADHEDLKIKARLSTVVFKITKVVADRIGMYPEDIRLIYDGKVLWQDNTLEESGMRINRLEEVLCRPILKGGKPVIYPFAPSALDSVRVDLTLVPEWTFSALYPLADIHRGKNATSTTSWTVSASPDGTLGARSSPPSLARSPPTDALPATTSSAFNPGRPSLSRDNAALLPFVPFLAHLDSALTSLTLHTSARNDFITYWLPSFQRIHEKGQQIAFRFLEQASYELSAKLEVEPKPDVVTRVFLLFKGVGEEQAQGWRKVDEVNWVQEVGADVEAAGDEKRFRVLEWGGMEVLG